MKKLSTCMIVLFVCLSSFKALAQAGTSLANPVDFGILTENQNVWDDQWNDPNNGYNNYIGQPSPEIYYKFTLTHTMQVNVSLNWSYIDTFVHLLDASGNDIVTNDDNGPLCAGTASSLEAVLPAGTYYVASEGSGNNVGEIFTSITGAYAPLGSSLATPLSASLLVQGATYTDTQNNDPTIGFTNQSLGPGGQPGNQIFYNFTLDHNMVVDVSLCNSSIDTYLLLEDANGNILASNDDNGPACAGQQSSLQVPLGPGNYYVVAEGAGYNYGSITTSITGLDVTLGSSLQYPINAGTLDGSSFTDTKNNDASNGFSNQLGLPGNDICYQFNITQTSLINVSLCNSTIGAVVHLLDQNHNEILLGDQTGPMCTGVSGSLVTTILPGTYYLVSDAATVIPGNITTAINVTRASGVTPDDPIYAGASFGNCTNGNFTDTKSNDPASGYGNGIYYSFSVESPTTVTISTCSSAVLDTHISFYGNPPYYDNTGFGPICNTSQASMQLTLPRGGYWFSVNATNFDIGDITTTITSTPVNPTVPAGAHQYNAENLGTVTATTPLNGAYDPTDCYEYGTHNLNLYQKYYQFHVNAPTPIQVAISNCTSDNGGDWLILTDVNGNQIASSFYGGPLCSGGYNASIIQTLGTGDYYVIVPSMIMYGQIVYTSISVYGSNNGGGTGPGPGTGTSACLSNGPLGPLVVVPQAASLPSADLDKNWIATTSYDEDGNVIAESRDFFDNNGQAIQTQVKNETTGHVLANQTVYDFQGRPVITTLSAPTNNSEFAFKSDFVTSGSIPYSYLNFDGDPSSASPYAKLNNPDAVDKMQPGTLGWYYSDNNTFDSFVASTSYPYSRNDFYHDGTGATKRNAGVGEQLVMGSGHETTSNNFPVQNELYSYLLVRNQFFPAAVVGNAPTNMAGHALQSISTDQNGLSTISIADLTGKSNLVTGRADPQGWFNVSNSITLTPAANDYEVTVNTNGSSTGAIYPANSFYINSPNNVTVTRNGVTIFNSIGDDFVFDSSVDPQSGNGYNYVLKSASPFSYSVYAFVAPLVNPTVALVDDGSAPFIESATTSVQYFQINYAQNINITGPYQLFDMKSETEITNTFVNGGILAPGYYKLMAKPGYDTNNLLVPVTMSYSNSYSDVSFNYYNQLGQLIASVTPNGVKQLINAINSSTLNSISALPYTTTYEYDQQGRMIASTSTDGGRSEFIYRNDGKIRFSQNSVQRNSTANYTEKFSYTNYDELGRPVESGEYVIPVGSTPAFQSFKTNATLLENVDPTNTMMPAGTIQDWIRTHYDLPDNSHGLVNYTQDGGFLKGAVSWTENSNSKTWFNYDDHGRVLWIIKQISGLNNPVTIDYTYNGQGNVTLVDYQTNNVNERFVHYYTYDADGRMIQVQTSRDGISKIQQARYYYYLHGPLKRVELGDQNQGIDYVYTPQGWLKSINHPSGDPTKDPNQDGIANAFAPDAFGMQLEYFGQDYSRANSNINSVNTGQQTYYNGNVNGIGWQGKKTLSSQNLQSPSMYSYSYDPKYQLTGATWGTPNYTAGSTSFTPGNTFNETLSNGNYDPNGNILGITRNDVNGLQVDNFDNYQYQPGTNKLISVGSTTNSSSYATYTYDGLGQVTSIIEPGLPTHHAATYYLKYDVTGKVTNIYSDPLLTNLIVSYTYDESGNRISRTNYTTSTPSTTYYVYDTYGNVMAIYNGPTLTEAPFYGNDRLGTYFLASNNYAYELRDNVGSVRVVINRDKKSDCTADVVSYNDYYPFGSIAQSGGTGYRYDYQGAYAEKDDVTGLNNFELRMYDSAIGRWLSTDPIGQYASLYEGMGNNPVDNSDPSGGYSWFGAVWRQGAAFFEGRDPSSIYKSGDDWGFNADGKSYFGPQEEKHTQPAVSSTLTIIKYIPHSAETFENQYVKTVTEKYTGHVYGEEGRITTNNLTISDRGFEGGDTFFHRNGVGVDGAGKGLVAEVTFGETTYTLGLTVEGIKYGSYIVDDGKINGQITTFTPKPTSAAIATAVSINKGVQNTANWLHRNFPPLGSPGAPFGPLSSGDGVPGLFSY